MKRILALLSTLLLTSVPSIAQDESCSTLTIQKGSTRPDYDTLRLRLEGAPANSLGWLALGATDQPSVLTFGPTLALNLGISDPIAGSFVGLTNGDGAISRTTYVPVEYELHFFVQAIILEDKGSGPQRFSFCTSNVIELDL